MRRLLGIFIAGVALPLGGSLPCQAVEPQVRGILEWRAQLEAQRAAEYRALYQQGQLTQANARVVDEKYLNLARQMEVKRTIEINNLSKASGVENIGQNPKGGTMPREGRGIGGDVDTRPLSAREFNKVVKAAESAGYTVEGGGDARTIKEIETTVHRKPSQYSPQGSSAGEIEVRGGLNKETALSVSDPNKNPATKWKDNLTKAGHTLEKPPAKLTNSEVQEMAKMTERNIKVGGVKNEALNRASEMIKQGYSPESAGVVPENATASQRTEALGEYQKQCRSANMEAGRNTLKQSAAVEGQLEANYKTANARLEAAKASGDPGAVQRARVETGMAKEELVTFKGRNAAATEGLVRNQEAGARLLSEASSGPKLEPVTSPEGKVSVRNSATGETMSPSKVRETALGKSRINLAKTVKGPVVEPPPEGPVGAKPSGIMKAGTYVLIPYMGYEGIKHGAAQAVEEEKPGDSKIKTSLKAAGYSVAYATGIPQLVAFGQAEGEKKMNEYMAAVAEGKEELSFGNWLKAKAASAGSAAGNFAKAMTWGQLVNAKNAVVEGVELGGALSQSGSAKQQAALVQQRLQGYRKSRGLGLATGLPLGTESLAAVQAKLKKPNLTPEEKTKLEIELLNSLAAIKKWSKQKANGQARDPKKKDGDGPDQQVVDGPKEPLVVTKKPGDGDDKPPVEPGPEPRTTDPVLISKLAGIDDPELRAKIIREHQAKQKAAAAGASIFSTGDDDDDDDDLSQLQSGEGGQLEPTVGLGSTSPWQIFGTSPTSSTVDAAMASTMLQGQQVASQSALAAAKRQSTIDGGGSQMTGTSPVPYEPGPIDEMLSGVGQGIAGAMAGLGQAIGQGVAGQALGGGHHQQPPPQPQPTTVAQSSRPTQTKDPAEGQKQGGHPVSTASVGPTPVTAGTGAASHPPVGPPPATPPVGPVTVVETGYTIHCKNPECGYTMEIPDGQSPPATCPKCGLGG